MQRLWNRVPTIVKTSCMVGTSMFVGDAICQKVENRENGKEWDTKRSQIMGITGLCVSGPISHTVVYTLERFIPGNSVKASLMKMTCNSVLAPVTMSILFTAVLLMKGKTIDDAREKIKQDVPKTWVAGAAYWPIIGFLNFRHTPIQYRPLVGSMAGIVWNIFMSSQTNREVVRATEIVNEVTEQQSVQ